MPFHGQVIHREVGDTHTIERVPFTFTTIGNAERLHPNIHIDFERNLRGRWGLIPEGGTRKVSYRNSALLFHITHPNIVYICLLVWHKYVQMVTMHCTTSGYSQG